MSILTKVLIGLVVVSVFPLLFFTAATLRVQREWRSKIDAFETTLAQERKEQFDLLHGDRQARVEQFVFGEKFDGQEGLKQREVALAALKLGRGRFWYAQRDPNLMDAAAKTLKVKLLDDNPGAPQPRPALPGPSGIQDKSFIYVFQMPHYWLEQLEPSSDDRYVGEFIVDGYDPAATDGLLPLKPAQSMTDQQWAALSTGKDTWILYEHMPLDDHNVFNEYDDDKIRALLPDSVEKEYVFDDQEPTDEILNDPKLKEFVAEDPDSGVKKFLRPLRDYQQIFRNATLRLIEINDRLVIVKKEKEYAERAKVQAEALITTLDARKAKLMEEKAKLDAEEAIVQAHATKLQALLVQVQQDLNKRLAENRALADQLAGRGKAKTAGLFAPENSAAQTP